MDARKTLKEILFHSQDAEDYWQLYHQRNNRNIKKHLLSHSMLLVVALRKREAKEIVIQSWLASAVIPVHIISSMRRSEISHE